MAGARVRMLPRDGRVFKAQGQWALPLTTGAARFLSARQCLRLDSNQRPPRANGPMTGALYR